MTASFGDRVKRLRLSTLLGGDVLSINALARRAQVDPAYVFYIEAGRRQHPSVPVVLRFARALGCSELETAELLVSAGHWPWPDADDATTALLTAVGCAIVAGDYRPYGAPDLMVPAQSISNSDTMSASGDGETPWRRRSSGS